MAFQRRSKNNKNVGVNNQKLQVYLSDFFSQRITYIIGKYKNAHAGANPSTDYISAQLGKLNEEDFNRWLVYDSKKMQTEEDAKEWVQAARRPNTGSGYTAFYGSFGGSSKSLFETMKLGSIQLVNLSKFGGISGKESEIRGSNERQLNLALSLGTLLNDWKQAEQLGNETQMRQKEQEIINFTKNSPVPANMLVAGAIMCGNANLKNEALTHYNFSLSEQRRFVKLLFTSLQVVDEFAINPSKYIQDYAFDGSTIADDFTVPVLDISSSEEVWFPHYHQRDRKYYGGWIASAKISLGDGIATLALDIAEYGEKNGLSHADIIKMGEFAGLHYTGSAWAVNESKVKSLASRIFSNYHLSQPTDYTSVVRKKDFMNALKSFVDSDGNPLFQGISPSKFLNWTYGKNRHTEDGAKASFILDYLLAASNMRLNWQFVLTDFFKTIVNPSHNCPLSRAMTPDGIRLWEKHFSSAGKSPAALKKTQKFFSEGTATHETPLHPKLLKSNWYSDVYRQLEQLNTNKLIYNYKGTNQPLSVGNSSPYFHLAGEPVVSLTTFYPSLAGDLVEDDNSVNKFIQSMLEEAKKRQAAGTYGGLFEQSLDNILGIVEKKYVKYDNGQKLVSDSPQDGYSEFYELPESKRAEFLSWIKKRKTGKGTSAKELPQYASYNYLNSGRFNGVGAYILTRIELETRQFTTPIEAGQTANFPYTVSAVSMHPSGESKMNLISQSGSPNLGSDISVSEQFKIYSPNDFTTPGTQVPSKNVLSYSNGQVRINTANLPDSRYTFEHVSDVTVSGPQSNGLGKTPDGVIILYSFDISVDTQTLQEFLIYGRAKEEMNDGSFYAAAGSELPPFISTQMQVQNAGTPLQIQNQLETKMQVQIVAPGDVKWMSSGLGTFSIPQNAGYLNVESDAVHLNDVIVQMGSPGHMEDVRIMDAILMYDFKTGEGSKGVVYVGVKGAAIQSPPRSQVSEISPATLNNGSLQYTAEQNGDEIITKRPIHSLGIGYVYDEDSYVQGQPLSYHSLYLVGKTPQSTRKLEIGGRVHNVAEVGRNIFERVKHHEILDNGKTVGEASFKLNHSSKIWELAGVEMNKDYFNSILLEEDRNNNMFSGMPDESGTINSPINFSGNYTSEFFFSGQESEKVLKSAVVKKSNDKFVITNYVPFSNSPSSVCGIGYMDLGSSENDAGVVSTSHTFYLMGKSSGTKLEMEESASLPTRKIYNLTNPQTSQKVGFVWYELTDLGEGKKEWKLGNVSIDENFRQSMSTTDDYSDNVYVSQTASDGSLVSDAKFKYAYDGAFIFAGPDLGQLGPYKQAQRETEQKLSYLGPVHLVFDGQRFIFDSYEYPESTPQSPKRKLMYNGLHVFDLNMVNGTWKLIPTVKQDGSPSADFEKFIKHLRATQSHPDLGSVLESMPSRLEGAG